ncbi:hypothetical protein TRFO_31755 [Tritrichomonas foetus]|uniref:Uncharacterized protein n=1 Tax=Tritrichomonas foetus TaxID=1144522 RepID=A0A1J4JSN1_9EUKA|nr:hypothetical protein TRFO_31755 [Tritrichomonas foetus]|eukprot:OHT01432.1 hypothetical protein TRFO_31755 [Tritrichomonas foetus]
MDNIFEFRTYSFVMEKKFVKYSKLKLSLTSRLSISKEMTEEESLEQIRTSTNPSNSENNINLPIDNIDPTQWENQNVQSIQEVREAEIETKKYLMRKENNEMTSLLVTKETQLQKQVRGITEECGKLRLEVGWLEKDLSQVKETARRQILETQTALQYQKLKIEDDIREKAKEIKYIQKKVENQRDELTQKILLARSTKTNQFSDLDFEIQRLNKELEEVTQMYGKAGVKYDDSTIEAKQTAALLQNEIRTILNRSGELDKSVIKEKSQLEELTKKLKKAERESEKIKVLIQKESEERAKMRGKLSQGDQTQWLERISSLVDIDTDLTIDADI